MKVFWLVIWKFIQSFAPYASYGIILYLGMAQLTAYFNKPPLSIPQWAGTICIFYALGFFAAVGFGQHKPTVTIEKSKD